MFTAVCMLTAALLDFIGANCGLLTQSTSVDAMPSIITGYVNGTVAPACTVPW